MTADVVDVPEPLRVVKAGLESVGMDGVAGFAVAVASTLARAHGNGTLWYGTHRDASVFQQATSAPIPETLTALHITTHRSRT